MYLFFHRARARVVFEVVRSLCFRSVWTLWPQSRSGPAHTRSRAPGARRGRRVPFSGAAPLP
eukprot:2129083-Pleurochrysis_carterae.AAC.1